MINTVEKLYNAIGDQKVKRGIRVLVAPSHGAQHVEIITKVEFVDQLNAIVLFTEEEGK